MRKKASKNKREIHRYRKSRVRRKEGENERELEKKRVRMKESKKERESEKKRMRR